MNDHSQKSVLPKSKEALVREMVNDVGSSQYLHTISDYLRWTLSLMNQSSIFLGHGTDNTWDESLHLVLGLLDLPLDINPELLHAKLLPQEKDRLQRAISLRVLERVPTPYLTGKAWFSGFEFIVNSDVLIPRSPIGELIDQYFAPWWDEQTPPHRVMDLCAGSGCIGIAIALVFPEVEVDLVDLSEKALDVARQNIDNYKLADRVRCISSDLFENIPSTSEYDLIVSNPPYVDEEDLASMPKEFGHEPSLALEAGKDGLDLVNRILEQSKNYLTDEGILIVEVGNSHLALQQKYSDLSMTWLEFARGGHGVFMLSSEQLNDYFNEQ